MSANRVRHQAVYETIRNGILSGEWKEHDRLPSVRALAEKLAVHRLTVFKVYQRLKMDRFVYVKDKSGYFVSPAAASTSGSYPEIEGWQQVPATSFYRNRSRLAEIHQHQVQYRMSEALIDPNLLPNLFLTEYVKKVFDLYPKVLGTYSPVQGDPELREALAQHFTESKRLSVTSEELMITSGSQQAIDLVSRALLRPGDSILVERPTYSAAIDAFRHQNLQLLPVDITPDGYDLEAVELIMQRMKPRLFYLNPTYHNPTGYTVPREQRKALVELAERYRCVLLEDDVFQEIYFQNPPPPPIFSYDTEGYVVYIRSYSKYIAPGLRISALAARPSLMREFLPVKSMLDNGTPLLNQKIFLHYFFSNRLQEHIAKLRIAIQLRKEKVESCLRQTDWTWTGPKGGLNLWVQVHEGLSVDTLLRQCLEQSVSFVPGSICDPLQGMDNKIRLSYALINEKQLEEGMRRLLAIAETMRE